MRKLKATNITTILLMVVFTGLFLLLFGRLLYIQAAGEVEGVNLLNWADEQRTNSYSLAAERGKILDRTGMVLADNKPAYNMYAILNEEYSQNSEEPLHVDDPTTTANKLAPLLNMDETKMLQILNDGIRAEKFQVEFVPYGQNLNEQTKQEIEALSLPGIYFSKVSERYYPNGQFASHLIGFAQKTDEGNFEGAMGIEKYQEEFLSGEPGYISFQRDNYAVKLLNPEEVVKKPIHGNDIYLTIDQKVQTFLEDAMSQVHEQYEPERIMAVVMNPKTGEILGMSSRPSFDPNIRANIENWYNDIISYPFEPGSTMKMFTIAAAIDAGVYNGSETYQSGKFTFLEDVRPIYDHKKEGWGPITYDEGFQRSSNVAVSKLVWEKLGTEAFLEYLNRFDFDTKTGIDVAGEIEGHILFDWPSEKLASTFGQGTTVTPIQLMKAASAIANEGKMIKPYVISKVIDSQSGDILQESKPEIVGEPISAETANQVMDLLETVVTSEVGTGKVYGLENYSVAGKTGTAQIPDPETGGFLSGKENYIFSFLGMAPKEDPELMMYVAVKRPKLADTEIGNEPVSYIFKTVMENSLHYLNIKPDLEKNDFDVQPYVLPDYTGQSIESVQQELVSKQANVKVVGSGDTVKSILPSAGAEIIPGSNTILLTDGDVLMPDLTNWSLRQVLQLGTLLNIKVDYIGTGYVVKQSIPVGTKMNGNQYLSIALEPPNTVLPAETEDTVETNEDLEDEEVNNSTTTE
ncbi:penicillin-binding protein 2B [Salirhabdus euzebyi]|uniref:serine-type D-Ala-D-Ala carboxypeptidase n=1 Tax=Salirhabdus euzebyi TaxID=394506 RepID=A0A841Q9Q4_9BACI|nr:penicillin-binding protein [Salirhabdus euzebyi]MBB6455024.1 penicillin-binding protein 2B [Salirhabdus euzebyi]